MSQLLNSGVVGVLDKDKKSNDHIYHRWNQSGLLDGLDEDMKYKVAIALEIAANMILMEDKKWEMVHTLVGEMYEGVDGFDVVIFPILRRVISKLPEAVNYVPEIIQLSRKEYDTFLWRCVREQKQPALAHMYDNVLPKWSEWHKKREYKNYEEFKRYFFNKIVNDPNSYHRDRVIAEGYDNFVPMDWEAEYAAYVSDKVIYYIEQHIKEKENEADTI